MLGLSFFIVSSLRASINFPKAAVGTDIAGFFEGGNLFLYPGYILSRKAWISVGRATLEREALGRISGLAK
jgi:hypothetical protein